MRRGAVQNKKAQLLGAWLPDAMIEQLDRAVVEYDTDRSKFVRAAIREKLIKLGITEAPATAGKS